MNKFFNFFFSFWFYVSIRSMWPTNNILIHTQNVQNKINLIILFNFLLLHYPILPTRGNSIERKKNKKYSVHFLCNSFTCCNLWKLIRTRKTINGHFFFFIHFVVLVHFDLFLLYFNFILRTEKKREDNPLLKKKKTEKIWWI